MSYATKSLRLYLANRQYVLLVPIYAMLAMLVISILLAAIVGIRVGLPLPASEMSNNLGGLTAIPGFLIMLAVLAVNRNFAMALSFGSTRRDFWLGTTAGFILTASITVLGSLILLGLEKATDNWWIGARAFSALPLGNGDPVKLAAVIFVVSLGSMTLGAAFGTIFRAFGATATAVSVGGLLLLVLGTVALAVYKLETVLTWFADYGIWLGVLAGAVLALIGGIGSFIANRYATV